MNPGNFFLELKRRNVYKVAVAYAVVAWLTIQAASIFLPAFNAPQWAMQIVILILVVGFPIALVFSWAFEITPEGIKRESEVQADESITHHTGRKIVALTIVLAVIATGLLIFQFVRARSTSSLSTNASSITNKSIAVLPFDNLSGDPQNAYFSEGVQDEILTRLAKIAELKVISRTSTQRFKSAPNDLRQIAQQLGVANILEGTVQKAGEKVRELKEALEQDPRDVSLTANLASAYNWLRMWKDAGRTAREALSIDPHAVQGMTELLRSILDGSGDVNESIRSGTQSATILAFNNCSR